MAMNGASSLVDPSPYRQPGRLNGLAGRQHREVAAGWRAAPNARALIRALAGRGAGQPPNSFFRLSKPAVYMSRTARETSASGAPLAAKSLLHSTVQPPELFAVTWISAT